ncbi:MAG TPA: hypothetical protein VFB60_01780 [Ktedonobacteraceae bacterium]|nr:hypothetical protein [Ktedonobacteraceae bacterium]
MLSRLNYFMIQLAVSIRWSYWLVIAAVLITVVAPMALHFFAGLSMIHLATGPLDPHPQG